MPTPEQPRTRLPEQLRMAKPGIPVKNPLRREIPDVPDPMPERRLPTPVPATIDPAEKPREPIPA